jgi:translation initiation factor 4E
MISPVVLVSGGVHDWDTLQPEFSSNDVIGSHPLNGDWSLWYDDKPKAASRRTMDMDVAANFQNHLQLVGNPKTVESFWAFHDTLLPPSLLENSANYHLFRHGFKPMWEAYPEGGYWVIYFSLYAECLDAFWTNVLMGVTGGTLDPENKVIGVVV